MLDWPRRQGPDARSPSSGDDGRAEWFDVVTNTKNTPLGLYLYDSLGKEVGRSADVGGAESITTGQLAPGRYRIVVMRYATVEAAYAGRATLFASP